MHDNFMHPVISCCERWRFDLLPFAENNRHAVQPYRRCGASDLLLPAVSLGLSAELDQYAVESGVDLWAEARYATA